MGAGQWTNNRVQVHPCGACRSRARPPFKEDERMSFFITRREALALGAAFGAFGFSAQTVSAQQRFFRIGTGGTGGTYYPVGGMIANAVSTDKINVSAVATNGSGANTKAALGGA